MSSAETLPLAGARTRPGTGPVWLTGIAAALAWGGAAWVTRSLPDIDDFDRTNLLALIMAGIGLVLAVLALTDRALPAGLTRRVRHAGPWLVLLAVVFTAWELVTAKFAVLPRPFFASPQAMLEVFTDNSPAWACRWRIRCGCWRAAI